MKREKIIKIIFYSILCIAIVFCLINILSNILIASFGNHNSLRLVWPVSLKYGYQMYYPPLEGPIICRMYGPFMVLSYLPCLIFQTPVAAICFGSFLSLFYFSFPLFFLLLRATRDTWNSKTRIIFGLCLLWLIVFLFHSMTQSAFDIRPDALALGCAAMACALLCFKHKKERRALFLSALFLAVSVWTKQTMIFACVALCLYVLVAKGKKDFFRYFLFLFAFLSAFAILFLNLFDAKGLIFEMFIIPAKTPLRAYPGGSVFKGIMLYLLQILPFLLGLLAINLKDVLRVFKKKMRFVDFLKENKWTSFVFVGLFMIPISFLGLLKAEGSVNNLSFYLYFFAIATIFSLMKLGILDNGKSSEKKVLIYLSLLLVFLMVATFGGSWRRAGIFFAAEDNPQKQSYQMMLEAPEEMYFPDNALSMLLATGRLYHDANGFVDKTFAGFVLDKEPLQKHLPLRLRFLVLPSKLVTRHLAVFKYFPDFEQKFCPEKSSWCFYRRK